jgi:hypothetical protein
MRQYRPDVERQKLLYSRMKSRALLRRLQGKPPVNTAIAEGRKQIPDNSEPWLPGEVSSVADAIWISDRIKETLEQWRIPSPQHD